MEDFRIRDARTSSKVTELTVEDLFCHQIETSDMDSSATETKATEWTDEKHMLYLKSLEASFIKHNYDILRRPSSSNSNSSSSFDQFKTCKGGCWQTISFDKGRSALRRTEQSDTLISNTWTQRLRPACRDQVMSSNSFNTMDADQEIDSREVSDQNFVNQIIRGSESDNRSVKRLRIDPGSATESSGDQMVPFRWFPTLEDTNVWRKTRKD